LQVEHPVTELVTGFDLVHEQFLVASGEPLSFRQEDVRWQGHAIECRVYAEDPDNNFFPSPGHITHLHEPAGPGIRVDSGVSLNSEVSIYYDPMIAKLAVWGATREASIDRLKRALDEYHVGGITTNLSFFRVIARDPEFVAGQLDTGFISRFNQRRESMQPEVPSTEEIDLVLVAAAIQYSATERSNNVSGNSKPTSRWKMAGRTALLNARDTVNSHGN
jgi:acetyl-CoA carboxylase, biotin carboxylase subunit